tara:strand:- start:1688 stop:1912 length:225 start_codon:yes stop_codon:yes gene_type:complete
MNEVTCNKCGWQGEEEDLVMFEDEDGFGKGCPSCKTDCYLMDKEMKNNDWHTLTANQKIHILEGESLDKKEMIE